MRIFIFMFPVCFLLTKTSARELTARQSTHAEKHRAIALEALKHGDKEEACEEFGLAAHYLPGDPSLKKHLSQCSRIARTRKPHSSQDSRGMTKEDKHLVSWILRTIAEAFRQF